MTAALSPLRKDRITGSRAPAILAPTPYTDRDGVMRSMVRQHFGLPDEFQGNIATDWGHEHEPDAIAEYERYRGVLVLGSQDIAIHPVYDYLAYTPDGLTGFIGHDGLVEVKCPFRARYSHISERPDHEVQCRLGMECFDRSWCDFVVWRPGGISVSRIERDPEWLPSVLPAFQAFIEEYARIIDDPELAAPHLVALPTERTDAEWLDVAAERLELAARIEADQAVLAELDERLVKLHEAAPELPRRGGGVLLVKSEVKGAIPYAKVLKSVAPDTDLEPFRGAPSVRYSVRRSKVTP